MLIDILKFGSDKTSIDSDVLHLTFSVTNPWKM